MSPNFDGKLDPSLGCLNLDLYGRGKYQMNRGESNGTAEPAHCEGTALGIVFPVPRLRQDGSGNAFGVQAALGELPLARAVLNVAIRDAQPHELARVESQAVRFFQRD